jgi:hypothetical protein
MFGRHLLVGHALPKSSVPSPQSITVRVTPPRARAGWALQRRDRAGDWCASQRRQRPSREWRRGGASRGVVPVHAAEAIATDGRRLGWESG